MKLSCAYIKADSVTNLKSITYIDMSGTTLNGKTSDILIPPYKTHTVFFDANGGSGSMDMAHMRDGETAALPANELYRSGYTFAGWSNNPSAVAADYADCASVNGGPDDLTLYAVWSSSSLSIKFDRDTAYYNAVRHYSGVKASGTPDSISGELDNPPLTVIVSGVSGTDVPEISWTSSDTDIVSIGNYWKLGDSTTYHYLNVLDMGTVTITVSLPNGSEASCTIVLQSTNSFGISTCVEQPAPTYPSITLEISTAN